LFEDIHVVVTIADQHLRKEIARFIQDGLAQQLTGILLAAKGLTRTLEERKALEATEAEQLVHLLKAANKEIHVLLNKLK
jgi:signal transduction histidine kinase